jgi:hypothetical protein
MSPTIFREAGLRFYFFSREETRLHVHVEGSTGEAKFWLEPKLELAEVHGLSQRLVGRALQIIRKREDEIRAAWKTHFSR